MYLYVYIYIYINKVNPEVFVAHNTSPFSHHVQTQKKQVKSEVFIPARTGRGGALFQVESLL